MRKRLKPEDRRMISKINTRRAKGMTWQEIADDLKFNSAAHAYNWINDRALPIGIGGAFIPIDRVTEQSA